MVLNQGLVLLGIFTVIITFFFIRANICAGKGKTKIANNWLLVGYFVYILMAAFRVVDPIGKIGGNDANVYRDIYRQAGIGFIDYVLNFPNEKGYLIVNWIVKHTCDDYRVALGIFHSIAYFYEARFILSIKVRHFHIFTYMGFFLITGNLFFMFAMMRNGIVIAMIPVAFVKAKEGNFKRATVISFATLLIHYSGIVLCFYLSILYIYERCKMKSKLKMVLFFAITFFACCIIMVLSADIIGERYPGYVMSNGKSYIAYRSYLAIIVLLLSGLMSWSYIKSNALKYEMIVLLYSLCFFVFNIRYSIVYRMIYDMLPIMYFFIMEMTDEIRITSGKYRIGQLVLLVFTVVYMPYRCYALVMLENLSGLPYINSLVY